MQVLYFIKWEGYEDSDNTWEPADNLDCDELVKQFEKNNRKSKDKDRRTTKDREKERTKDRVKDVEKSSGEKERKKRDSAMNDGHDSTVSTHKSLNTVIGISWA